MVELRLEGALVTSTARELLRKLGKPFEATISAYLNSKYGTGIELIEENPREFYNALRELFGEFAARVFLYDLLKELNRPVDSTNVDEMIKVLGEYIGGQ